MYNPFKNFSDSLKNSELGWSGRKMTAFALTCCVVAMHIGYYLYAITAANFALFTEVLIIDLCAIAFFMGLVTVANLIELRTGRVVKETTTTEAVIEKKDLEKSEG